LGGRRLDYRRAGTRGRGDGGRRLVRLGRRDNGLAPHLGQLGLSLLEALGEHHRLLTQRGGFPGVGEVQEHQDGQAHDGGKPGIRSHR
jgi:hypothetical protein